MQYNTCVVRPYMAHTYTAAQTYVPPLSPPHPPPHTHLQQESGGTVLSTNWSEIGQTKVERKPPDGMEWKDYEK